MTARDQRMIAHMGVKPERELHAAADVSVVAVAKFDHLVAKNGIGYPGDHPLQHVVVVELAGEPAGALWLPPIAHPGRESDDLDGAVFTAEIPGGGRRIRGLQACLDEADRVGPDHELTIPGDVRRLSNRLTLCIQVPRCVAVDELSGRMLALDRNSAAAARGVVPLNTHIVPFLGLASEVCGDGIA